MPTQPSNLTTGGKAPIVMPDLKDVGTEAKVDGQSGSKTPRLDPDQFDADGGSSDTARPQSPRAEANAMIPKKRGFFGKVAAAIGAIGVGLLLMFGINNMNSVQELPLNPPAIEQPGDVVPITPGQGPPANGTVIPAEPATPPPNNGSIPPVNNGDRIPQIELEKPQIVLPNLKDSTGFPN